MTILAMSLKVNKGPRTIIKWVIWGVVGILFLVFLIRVLSFENAYYNEKDGSERAVTAISQSDEELVEEKPSENEVREYTVAPDRPRYLTVEKVGIVNARILPMGVNTDGELDTPRNIFDVGWYEGSSKPGQGGTLIIDGHNGGPHVHGVFKELPSLSKGDIIKVERGDGEVFRYEVVENNAIALNESNAYMSTASRSPEPGTESVTLISCTGEWSQAQDTYLSRQFTRAVLIND
ncbi:class F sortase [Candidatus Saccharibacteria bacterium]|nr:class F sortase [Candidatus Saccharibacteria bacterium]